MSFESLEQDAFGKLFLREAVWTTAVWTLPLFLSPPNPICIKASGNKRRQPCLDNRKQQVERQREELLWSYVLEIGEKEARRSLKQSRSAFRWACIQPGCAAVSPASISQVPDPFYLHIPPTSCIFCMHPLVTTITYQNADLPYLTWLMSNDIRSPYAPSEHKREVTEAEKGFWGPKNLLLTVLGTWKGKKALYLALFCSQSLLSPP